MLNNNGKYCYSFIPARYVFVFLGFVGFNLLYAYKVAFNVAIVAMAKHSSNNSDYSEDCIANKANLTSKVSPNSGELNWDSNQQSLLLGAFFYGYAITQLPGGILAAKYGSKWVLGGSILVTALLQIIGPLAARMGFIAFFVVRVGQGLFEGLVFPCMIAMFAQWLPKMERSIGSTIVITGAQIGTVITLPLTGYLCDGTFMGGWPAIFYLSGIAGCIWFAFWAFLIHETPDRHPHISHQELEYIKRDQGQERVSEKRPNIPWSQISKSVPMWAMIITHFGNNWGLYTVLTLLPTYFQKILLLDIKNNGLLSSLPWLLSALMSWIAGLISDKVRSKGGVPINYIRKICNSIGFIGPAVCLVAVVLFRCETTIIIIFFASSMGLNGISYSGFLCTHVDMAPDFAGTLFGITNTIASLPGFLAPIIANALTKENQNILNWSYVFYLSAAIYFLTSLVYIFFASAELQPWAKKHETRFLDKNIATNIHTITENEPQNIKGKSYNRINKGFIDD